MNINPFGYRRLLYALQMIHTNTVQNRSSVPIHFVFTLAHCKVINLFKLKVLPEIPLSFWLNFLSLDCVTWTLNIFPLQTMDIEHVIITDVVCVVTSHPFDYYPRLWLLFVEQISLKLNLFGSFCLGYPSPLPDPGKSFNCNGILQ